MGIPQSNSEVARPGRAGKVLVLDDEEHYATMLQKLLQQHRFVVDSATRPEQALEALEEHDFDLVISDYKMPVMDGADFLQKARQIRGDLPVILVSGLMNTPELVKVANMSVTLVLEKPIDVDSFIAQVSRFVAPLSEEDYERYLQQRQFGAGAGLPVVRTYPAEPAYFPDRSIPGQHFLQQLWDTVSREHQVFVAAPAGAEQELVLRQILAWQGEDERRITLLHAAELAHPGGLERITEAGSAGVGSAVGLYGIAELDGAGQQELRAFLEERQMALPNADELCVVGFFNAGVFNRRRNGYDRQLFDYISGGALTLPPLAERLPDLAVLIRRCLIRFAQAEGTPQKERLDPACMGLLLQHRWPGNFAELVQVLRRAVALGGEGPLSAEQVAAILFRIDPELEEVTMTPSLEACLLHRQREVLHEKARHEKGSTASILGSLGIDATLIPEETPIEELGLVYPELLEVPEEEL